MLEAQSHQESKTLTVDDMNYEDEEGEPEEDDAEYEDVNEDGESEDGNIVSADDGGEDQDEKVCPILLIAVLVSCLFFSHFFFCTFLG